MPKNGLYITESDFQQWGDHFSTLANSACSSDNREGRGIVARNITFIVTEQCNLACTYCYETHKTTKRMSKEVAKQAVDFIFDKEKINGYWGDESQGVILDFIGGEPLLEIDLMDYIVEYFKFKAFQLKHPWFTNYMISVSTNGTLFLSNKVQRFMERNPGKVSMSISIDGNKDLHDACRVFHDGRGSYDVVEKAVKKNVSLGNVYTKMTVSPFNIQHLVEAIQNLWDLGLKGGMMNVVFEKGWNIHHARLLYQKLKEVADIMIEKEIYKTHFVSFFDESIGTPRVNNNNYCGGNGEMLAISVDGKCSPCLRFLKYSLFRREEQIVGDIFTELESKEKNRWLNRLKNITMTSQSPPKCQDCQVASGCGGCTAFNYDFTGNPDQKATFSCKMHRARVLANVYFWNRLYRRLGLAKRFPMNMPLAWGLELVDEDEYWMLSELAKHSN
ncbi:radical SAM peptide maturase, CXXX-repeat target family [Brevibacillus sp. SYSU BS000544]|uniref:radical SAM peptide maturase, CXXX-repeat target family n=1 Tax=Brevibacillus sp. SYSU BS000544 TaxID=3416443 RepID=UPI003CE4BB93